MKRSISIILPVYNAERYLRECLDSVLKIQKLLDWELIVVDDGSKDSSPSICDEYSARDSRVRTFHIENKGVSNARNFGIAQATKNFVSFIDADDWIDAAAFSSAFDEFVCLNADLGLASFYRVENDKRTEQTLDYGGTRLLTDSEKEKFFKERLAPGIRFMGGVWRNFYSRKLASVLAFDESLRFNEDVFFNIQAMFNASSVAVVNTSFYYYRVNELSASFSKDVNSVDSRLLAWEKIGCWAREHNVDLSFALMRRHCSIIARLFSRASMNSRSRGSRIKALKQIHESIPRSEIRQWKISYFGKSFAPYVFSRRLGLDFLGLVYICARFF